MRKGLNMPLRIIVILLISMIAVLIAIGFVEIGSESLVEFGNSSKEGGIL
jgi:hypothetical protein